MVKKITKQRRTASFRIYSDDEIEEFLKEDKLPKNLKKKIKLLSWLGN